MKDKDLNPQIVERFIKAGKFGIRKDFLGLIDIIGFDKTQTPVKLVATQSTSLGQRKEHLKTILEDQVENTKLWLSTGNRLELICWRKLKRRLKSGGYAKNYSWEPKIDIITLDSQGNPIAEDSPNVQQQI